MDLDGRVAIVTGAGGGGSGRAIARRLAREGARVVVADIDEAGAAETVALITAVGGAALACPADVAREASAQQLIDFAEERCGGVDVIVNDASHDPGGRGQLEDWATMIAVDLLGPLRITLCAIAALRRRGGGAIVNIASESALGHGSQHSPWPAYDVAKAGVVRLTTTLDWLGAEGIRVNCLVPGWIASPPVTAFVDTLSATQRRDRGVPEHILSVDEVGEAVLALATAQHLAGRVLLLRNDRPPALIAAHDRGYSALEPFSLDAG